MRARWRLLEGVQGSEEEEPEVETSHGATPGFKSDDAWLAASQAVVQAPRFSIQSIVVSTLQETSVLTQLRPACLAA